MAPVHDMQNGDSFTVAVHTRVSDENVSMANSSHDRQVSDQAPENAENGDPEDLPQQGEQQDFSLPFYLYVQTWYIDHDRHRICSRPRPMRLEPQAVVWIDDFRHEWRDLLDRNTFFSIYVIKPRPPQFRHLG